MGFTTTDFCLRSQSKTQIQAGPNTHMQAKHAKHTHLQKFNVLPKDLLMRAQRQAENVNPHNQSSTPAKIDIGNGEQIVSLLIIVWW